MVLDAVINPLNDWLRDIRAERLTARNQETAQLDNRAARILHDASVLLATMQTYDNEARMIYRRVHLYASQIAVATEDPKTTEERRQAYESLTVFEGNYELNRRAQRYLGMIQNEHAHLVEPAFDQALNRLTSCGQRFVRITGEVSGAKERYVEDSRAGLSPAVRRCLANGIPHEGVAAYAEAMLDRVRPVRALLDEADLAYSELSATICRAHNLPSPPAINF
jgi:hypothetical protein